MNFFFFKKPVHFTCKTYQHLCKSSDFGSLRSPLYYLHVLWLCQKLNVCTITRSSSKEFWHLLHCFKPRLVGKHVRSIDPCISLWSNNNLLVLYYYSLASAVISGFTRGRDLDLGIKQGLVAAQLSLTSHHAVPPSFSQKQIELTEDLKREMNCTRITDPSIQWTWWSQAIYSNKRS